MAPPLLVRLGYRAGGYATVLGVLVGLDAGRPVGRAGVRRL
jgi:hypothetical protein